MIDRVAYILAGSVLMLLAALLFGMLYGLMLSTPAGSSVLNDLTA